MLTVMDRSRLAYIIDDHVGLPLARTQSFISKEIADTNSWVVSKNPTLAQ